MVFHNFDELIAHVKGQPSRARMAVAAAGDAHTIEAVLRARAEGIVTPILVGDKAVIDQVLAELGEHIPAEDIHDEPDLAEAARKAVALVRAGQADFLMKGKLDTSVLLKAVVNKETGLGKGGVMSHFTAFEIPTYHKLLMPVDGGMVTYPTLEQKKAIIEIRNLPFPVRKPEQGQSDDSHRGRLLLLSGNSRPGSVGWFPDRDRRA